VVPPVLRTPEVRWPWVSRLAFDAVREERDRLAREREQLLDQVGRLADHRLRMDRVDRGLGEHPRPPKPEPEPMPEEVEALIQRWDNGTIRDQLRMDAEAMYRKVGSWDRVADHMREAIE
jgi:hypothetical protein